ncbi:hypothetical protein [Arthrobacter sp. CC3]|uniref:hypothetical protein n=1 Tax=Arthrobacter sp. CC3 TaxID=3029185 RepID=UPI003265479D
MLVHAQLWDQARADAAALGKPGLDFTPLFEGQRAYIGESDLAICHQETPVADADGPSRPIRRSTCRRKSPRRPKTLATSLHHRQQPHHRPRNRRPGPYTGRAGRCRLEAHRFLPDRGGIARDPASADRRGENRRD